ncbi:MAG: DEAD/DEAH box helicase family protein [Verrucomicrobiales bacterium]|jgi:superfamily II DNA or RNA helicase/diadenosine tetraphosphate (Ap4A) HIT family hydrolase/HKD family nuclease/SOS-response transcriptional repressor LexA|nr:DEAD/DEAH box helicase family protein [Verrucomicrobiales bacterium]MBP9224221.1 DEAD/DEAH box helicase family protein [Verrucomicrobiales bacterium]
MTDYESPFHAVSADHWLCSNALAFAIFDGFPVSPGHVLVTTRRIVETWFEATDEEQSALMALVKDVKHLLDLNLDPKPDGYNVGFNSGAASGQTVPHVHIHVIPRYLGDMADPRGGVRHVIPDKGNYLTGKNPESPASPALTLTTGHPAAPLWKRIGQRVSAAAEIDLLASFIQPSGLDLIQQSIFAALRAEASIRILVGDYLYITSAEALRRLIGWMSLADDIGESCSLEVRLAEISKLPSKPDSFHPKAWRIVDSSGGLLVVGSSNLSKAALETGVEWNLIRQTTGSEPIDRELARAFTDLWHQATPLDESVVSRYAEHAKEAHRKFLPPESVDLPTILYLPRPWQRSALESLDLIRSNAYRRALVAVATGLGKTWLAAFDVLAVGKSLNRPPRVLIIAHRAEILIQAEATIRTAMQSEWEETRVTWYLGANSDMSGDLVVASVQKLTRPEGLAELDRQRFDYAVIDEVHHAQAPSYRRVMTRLNATFILGLTATPERTDGVDVASLFDDVLAWQATVGDGIAEGSLVPFHYLGLKDGVDFEQIPWRNGRFDPTALEEKLENSERMERLWTAWQTDPDARTLVFCCSRRHALYTRDWLRRRQVRAAAVFSGSGGDPRSDSLSDFIDGALQALCVVDLFNEGLDVPDVDRVVMLRPTESKVIFLQQLGRGLRAAENKLRLKVIDFVGNHRVFASRLTHLLSLGNHSATWTDLKKFLKGGTPDLPEGCLLDLEVEAKELMLRLVPNTGSAVVEAYRSMRDELGRRPSPSELFHHGYLPRTLAARFNSWFGFISEQDDLTENERLVFASFESWLTMLEGTNLNKSYKMVVLRVLLDRDALWDGMEIEKLAVACREFLLSHPTLRHDLPPTQQFPDPAKAPIQAWAKWWLEWPLSRWMDEQAGRRWFKREGDRFLAAFPCPENLRPDFETMTAELVDYRLAHYAKTRIEKPAELTAGRFVAKVSHSGGKPILRLPTVEELPGRPIGPTTATLPDGSQWVFKFVKIACNVASPLGSEENQILPLLRGWFGENAGAPGTNYQVAFTKSETGWTVEPVAVATPLRVVEASPETGEIEHRENRSLPGFVESPTGGDKFTRLVPVYSLEAAAGLWGPESTPEEIGWAEVGGTAIKPGMFIARVRGHSMEPKIKDGSWNLFRPCPAGSREGRIVLVQFNSMGDPENGGRFTLKKYHSAKTVSEDAWQHDRIELLPLNPDYDPIPVAAHEGPELVVVGEWVASMD